MSSKLINKAWDNYHMANIVNTICGDTKIVNEGWRVVKGEIGNVSHFKIYESIG